MISIRPFNFVLCFRTFVLCLLVVSFNLCMAWTLAKSKARWAESGVGVIPEAPVDTPFALLRENEVDAQMHFYLSPRASSNVSMV